MRVRIRKHPVWSECWYVETWRLFWPIWRQYGSDTWRKDRALEIAKSLQSPEVIELRQVMYY